MDKKLLTNLEHKSISRDMKVRITVEFDLHDRKAVGFWDNDEVPANYQSMKDFAEDAVGLAIDDARRVLADAEDIDQLNHENGEEASVPPALRTGKHPLKKRKKI